MLLLIKWAAKIFAALNGEVSTREIGAGVALGVLIGLVPIGLLPTLLFFLALLVNVNLALLGVAAAVVKIISFVVDPVAHQVGLTLLVDTPALKSVWTQLYNMPLVPYTRFNNTIVMGSFAIGLVLLVPVYFAAKAGVEAYRVRFRDRMKNSKLMKALQASTFYKYYVTFRDIRGS